MKTVIYTDGGADPNPELALGGRILTGEREKGADWE